MTAQEELIQARDLIKDKQYEKAYLILSKIDHPKATEWMQKLEDKYGVSKPKRGIVVSPAKSLQDQNEETFVKQRLVKARNFIEAKRYDDAYAVLMTLDHPKAIEWMQKIERLQRFATSQGPQLSTSTQVVVNANQGGPGCAVQVLWYLFVGWWLGQIAIGLAWLMMLSIIGLPIGIWLINNISGVIALRKPNDKQRISVLTTSTMGVGGLTSSTQTLVNVNTRPPQFNFFIRAIYFLLVGWWITGLWMELAYFFCWIIIGMPIGFWMFDKTPTLLTLRRT